MFFIQLHSTLKKEIIFTTLEEQGKSVREYSKRLSYVGRLALLQELIYTTHGDIQPSSDGELHIFEKDDDETFNEFFARVKRERKNAAHQ